jgi:hypothetical protein
MTRGFWIAMLATMAMGCPSKWKIHGGPPECEKMCKHWGLEFAAMVGVGDQSETGEGATACVCVKEAPPPPPSASPATSGAAASATSLAAPIVIAAAQAAMLAARQQQMLQQQQQQQSK